MALVLAAHCLGLVDQHGRGDALQESPPCSPGSGGTVRGRNGRPGAQEDRRPSGKLRAPAQGHVAGERTRFLSTCVWPALRRAPWWGEAGGAGRTRLPSQETACIWQLPSSGFRLQTRVRVPPQSVVKSLAANVMALGSGPWEVTGLDDVVRLPWGLSPYERRGDKTKERDPEPHPASARPRPAACRMVRGRALPSPARHTAQRDGGNGTSVLPWGLSMGR